MIELPRSALTQIGSHNTSQNRPQDKLASRLFLILHDAFSGRCAVSPTALRCALVGAELAELVLSQRIAMENDVVVPGRSPNSGGSSGGDGIAAFVMDSIGRQPDAYGVPVWLSAIGNALHVLVADRLVAAGILAHTTRFFGRVHCYPATDLLASAGPRVRLEHMVRNPAEGDVYGAVCAALLVAVGARRIINIDGGRRETRRGLAALTAMLPVDMHSLVMSVEVAYASGSLPPTLRLRPKD
jgi:hypothetical protein